MWTLLEPEGISTPKSLISSLGGPFIQRGIDYSGVVLAKVKELRTNFTFWGPIYFLGTHLLFGDPFTLWGPIYSLGTHLLPELNTCEILLILP